MAKVVSLKFERVRKRLYDSLHSLWSGQPMVSRETSQRITWEELGCPTEPCTRLVRGMHIQVRARDIKASQGRPDAVFIVSPNPSDTGPTIWLLSYWSVEIPEVED